MRKIRKQISLVNNILFLSFEMTSNWCVLSFPICVQKPKTKN